MTQVRAKQPRLRLEPAAYLELKKQVLKRDRWRCQKCGSPQDLQVHHIQLRSHSGDDHERNLITLCAGCHREIHSPRLSCGVLPGFDRVHGQC